MKKNVKVKVQTATKNGIRKAQHRTQHTSKEEEKKLRKERK